MKLSKLFFIVLFLGGAKLSFAEEACMQEVRSEWVGHSRTCYENISIEPKKFINLCLSNKLLEMEDDTAKITHEVVGKCPTPYLAACKGGNIPFINKKAPYNYYYYKNEGLKYIEKSCVSNGGNWITP